MVREKICGIYLITNLVNGKKYVGQSVDIVRRYNEHIADSKTSNQVLYKAMRKYGLENFSFEILIEVEKDLLDLMEIYYINKYNTYIYATNSNGYNMTTGGYSVSGSNSPNSKIVICEGVEFGCVDDFCNKYDIKRSKVIHWLCGDRRMPKEWYDKGLRYKEKPMSDYKCKNKKETNKKIKENHANFKDGNHPQARKVICNRILFKCIKDCANYYEVDRRKMNSWLLGQAKMPQKYIDMNLHYATEEEIKQKQNK